MKQLLALFLLLCAALTCISCAQTSTVPTAEPAAALPSWPPEITDGASEILTSMLSPTCGYLLKKGYPAIGLMQSTLYRTEDGQNWTVVREIHDDVHNYPRALYFWSEHSGVILTNYHGYDACVYLTLDGGTSWAPVPIEPHGVPAGYSYMEGERAWTENEKLMLELSAHYEDKEPVMFRVSADIP